VPLPTEGSLAETADGGVKAQVDGRRYLSGRGPMAERQRRDEEFMQSVDCNEPMGGVFIFVARSSRCWLGWLAGSNPRRARESWPNLTYRCPSHRHGQWRSPAGGRARRQEIGCERRSSANVCRKTGEFVRQMKAKGYRVAVVGMA